MRRIPVLALALVSVSILPLFAQDDAAAPDARQQAAAKTFAAKGKAAVPKTAPAKAAPLVPLTERERVLQMLDRFTFGPRPGDVDHAVAMGVGNWFEQQMPTIPLRRFIRLSKVSSIGAAALPSAITNTLL